MGGRICRVTLLTAWCVRGFCYCTGDTSSKALANSYPACALHGAVDAGDIAVIRALLQKNVDVDAQDRWGQTALHHAVRMANKPVIAELVANGASLSSRDKDGKQPIDYAAHSPELEMILQLLSSSNIPQATQNLQNLQMGS